ncbi:hypothetical protein HNR61_007056 [Actinomadura namibiensis]|uniref:Uncharacterized protein n=1 Tax=Actinomadura namibiensis TaxID=182080 RepID=A0A7W3LW91_ACTNM|nr:hypothetical protein [Actinomadura namibiensis]
MGLELLAAMLPGVLVALWVCGSVKKTAEAERDRRR